MATYTGLSGNHFRVRAGLALAAAGVLLAACGSSSKSASSGTTTSSTSPSAAASTSSGSSGSVSTNLGSGSFCDKAKQASVNLTGAAAGLATDTPAKLKQFEENVLTELKALRDQAPAEIKGAVSTIVDAETTLFNDLQAANFDFTKVGADIQTQFSTPQFTEATKQLDSYLQSKCGINPSAVPS